MSECACVTKERVAGDKWFTRGGGGGGCCSAGGGSGVGDETAGGGADGAGLPGADSSGVLRNDAGQPASCSVVRASAKIHTRVGDLTPFIAREQAKVLGFIP